MLCDACIVACSNFIGAYTCGHIKELIELNEVVAKRTRDGCTTGQIIGNERLDNMLFKLIFEINYVVGYANQLGNVAGIVNIVDRTAAARGSI